nr:HAMP domain-containing sensor histidine kinase [uncultured Arsenicibacter sp.]
MKRVRIIFHTIFLLCLATKTPGQVSISTSALREQLTIARHDTIRLRLCNALAEFYTSPKCITPDSALPFIYRGRALARKYRLTEAEARLYLHQGYYYKRIRNFKYALTYLLKGIYLLEKSGNTELKCTLYYRLACVCRDEGMFVKAFEYTTICNALAKQIHDSTHILRTLSLFSTLYQDAGRLRLALHYAVKTYTLAQKMYIGNPESSENMGVANATIADLYESNGQYTKAYPYWKKAQNMFRKYKVLAQLSEITVRLGKNYIYRNQPKDAIKHIEQAVSRKEIKADGPATYEIYALAYQELGNFTNALVNGQKAYQTATIRKTTFKHRISLLKMLISIEEPLKQYKQALIHMHQLALLNDSLFNIQKTEAIAKAEARFKLTEKEQTISLLRKNAESRKIISEKNKQEITLHKQRQLLLWLAVLMLITGIITLLVFFRRERDSKQLLTAQKIEIEEKAQHLHKANALKDKLFSIIAHDLRSPVATLKVFLQSHQGKPEQTNFSKYSLLKDNIDSLYITIDNLLHWSRLQQGELMAYPQKEDLAENAQLVLKLYQSQASLKQQTITTRFETATALIDEQHLQIIIRNLFQNAIKFTPVGGHIGLTVEEKAGYAILRIQDSGTGMPETMLSAVPVRSVTSMRGTANEKGTGLGLDICRELLSLNEGEMRFDSSPNGTTVTVTFKHAAA